MVKNHNPIIIDGIQTEGQCRDHSYYVRFTDEDINELTVYAFDLGYTLEPEVTTTDPQHPMRFKVICKTNPAVYGWISKVIEKTGDQWQDAFLYGFYRHGFYMNKYPITFNVQSHLMHGVIKRNTEKNPRQTIYYRTIYGIIALEPAVSPLDFILSWLWSIKFKHV